MEFDLNCWYVSLDKIAQAAGPDWLPQEPLSEVPVGNLQRVRVVAAAKDAVLEFLQKRRVKSLEEQIIREELREGALFTYHRDFYGKGLAKLSYGDPDIVNAPMALVYAKLRNLPAFSELRVRYHPSNIYSVSGWSALGGHERLFVAGYVDRLEGDVIHARPLVIGQAFAKEQDAGLGPILDHYGRVYPESIDEFSRMSEVLDRPRKSEMTVLKSFPERRIKEIIAELLGEHNIPQDWGGERSDLFTSAVHIDGRRLSAAFVLKGPAQFRKMTLASLGKNGDQVFRAFTEPAELVVLQHCHDVDSSVIATIRAFANQANEQRLFCVLDGADTWRLLKSYGYLVEHKT